MINSICVTGVFLGQKNATTSRDWNIDENGGWTGVGEKNKSDNKSQQAS